MRLSANVHAEGDSKFEASVHSYDWKGANPAERYIRIAWKDGYIAFHACTLEQLAQFADVISQAVTAEYQKNALATAETSDTPVMIPSPVQG